MKKKLLGKTAVVTGGGTGIGEAIAKQFAQHGADVFILGRRMEILKSVRSEFEKIDLKITAFKCDVSSESDVKEFFTNHISPNGKLDILVNNAAVFYRKTLMDTNTKEFINMSNVNFLGVFLMIKNAVPFLEKNPESNIINISSVAGCISPQGQNVYGSTKAAINHMTKGLAVELGPKGIKVNAIAPGPVNTPVWDTIAPDIDEQTKLKDMLRKKIPIGRIGEGEDISLWAMNIVSPDNTWMTGCILNIDGGRGLVT